ncbi:hypothetical protein BG011_007960 [Mortierella polycephala]|uniref:Uncharacterized protein n=1 Tax=Mortierella polycephala TaxID=41804 RepID=A0A9P6TXY2_9FUNG|nr:hypothetical protein BG011_007960 [Mortierella polycephala]
MEVLFSLDEVPTDFSQDMYIAMRNRIFELEAKAVNYSPFSHSRKRSMDRSGLEDYPDRHGYDTEPVHHSKRPYHGYPTHSSSRHHGPPDSSRPPSSPSHRLSSSYPSWYTPDVYTNGSQYPPHPSRPPVDREMDYRPPGVSYHNPDSRPNSRPGTPPPGTTPDLMCSAYSPPPTESSPRRPSAHHSHAAPPPQQSGPPAHESRPSQHHGEERVPHNGPYLPNGQSHPHHPPPHGPPAHSLQHPPSHPHTQSSSHHQPQGRTQAQQQQSQGYSQQQHHSQQPVHPNGPASGASSHNPMSSATVEQRQSIHQQRHRAQQQAQSAHSRSYHLHKHMRMLDQQRAAQLAAQQQQQQKQAQQQQGQSLHSIQRQYQSHQRMYPSQNQPIAIKPHPQPPQQHPMRPNPFLPQQRLTQQQQLIQRYQQQRQLQQKQQQLRQLQYLRSRSQAQYPTQTSSHHHAAGTTGSSGSHSPTPPRVFGSQVDRPIKKSTRPLECSNCMALDSLSWRPKAELQIGIPEGSSSTSSAGSVPAAAESKILCPACTQYLQTHGKDRPVPTFRINFLKKIHTRFKRELQEVRFQGWQDAQVLEIEDRMVEREFQMVFNGLDESDAAQIQSRQSSVSAKGSPVPVSASGSASEGPKTSVSEVSTSAGITTKDGETKSMSADAKDAERVVIKIEDDDDASKALTKPSKPENIEVRTFQSEASMGELFGHRWRTEPVVGYTLVHFGGSDRTRMVPMNPTVPSLTVTFNRYTESITFAFRVLVNGLCLLASGGGPPALHMPEMADDDESEEEEEVVVVPDNDKEDNAPPSTPSQGASSNQSDATTTTSGSSAKVSKVGDSTAVVTSDEGAPASSDGDAPKDTDADAARDK